MPGPVASIQGLAANQTAVQSAYQCTVVVTAPPQKKGSHGPQRRPLEHIAVVTAGEHMLLGLIGSLQKAAAPRSGSVTSDLLDT